MVNWFVDIRERHMFNYLLYYRNWLHADMWGKWLCQINRDYWEMESGESTTAWGHENYEGNFCLHYYAQFCSNAIIICVIPMLVHLFQKVANQHYCVTSAPLIQKKGNPSADTKILCIIHYSKKLKEHFDIMIFIERYPLKRCQGCVKLIASKVSCFLNINDLSEVQLCMSSNSWT